MIYHYVPIQQAKNRKQFKNTAAAPTSLAPPLIRTPLTNYYEEKENYFFSIITYAEALSRFGKFQKKLKICENSRI